MRCYTRLSCTEREEISRQLAVGASGHAIARQLGRAPSTIARGCTVPGACDCAIGGTSIGRCQPIAGRCV